ncbi:MAG: hypothetical protein ACOCZ6_01285 [Nanoarchaeota archaeon]
MDEFKTKKSFSPVEIKLFTLSTGDYNWLHDSSVMKKNTIVPGRLIENFALYHSEFLISGAAYAPKEIETKLKNKVHVREPVEVKINLEETPGGLEAAVNVNGNQKKAEINILYAERNINPLHNEPEDAQFFKYDPAISPLHINMFARSIFPLYRPENPPSPYLLSLSSRAIADALPREDLTPEETLVYLKNTSVLNSGSKDVKFDDSFSMEVYLKKCGSGYKAVTYGLKGDERIYSTEAVLKKVNVAKLIDK